MKKSGNYLIEKLYCLIKQYFNLTNVLILLISLFFSFSVFAQEGEKLAPAYRYVLSHPVTKENESSYPVLYKAVISEGLNTKTGKYEKGFTCIVYTDRPELLREKGITVQSELPAFVTVWATEKQLLEMAVMPEVKYIDAPTIVKPNNDVSVGTSGASLLHAGKINSTVYKGTGVIVGIMDSGIDWDHPDFRNATNQAQSRILRIWDQTLTPIGAEVSPSGLGYGVEYTQTHINNEIDGTPAGFVRESDANGHGTHVAGTAAGNGVALTTKKYTGIAPEADLVIVKGGNGSFSSTNVINSLTYFQNVANSLGKPIVVNMSLGGQFSAHDGTDPQEVAIDNFTSSAAGRVVVVAAGNDNGTLMHRQVTLPASGSTSVSLTVPAPSGTSSLDIFQFTLYSANANNFNATVTAPGGTTATANAGQSFALNVMGGTATVNITNGIDAGSGDRYLNVYVTRSTTAINPSGTWTITVNNTTAAASVLDGWLNYKGNDFSTTALVSGDNNYLVATPGCATSAITVGSYMAKLSWLSSSGATLAYNSGSQDDISTFSSVGPRRDNVQKPNITANGQAVVSTLSSNSGLPNTDNNMVVNGLYRVEQGTSMACPEVAGCAALLLQISPTATATDIKNAIQNTAVKDAFTTAVSNNTWGTGKIDIYKAASALKYCTTQSRETYSYDSSSTAANLLGINLGAFRAATRFTPTLTGFLGGVNFQTYASFAITSLTIEVRTNTAGAPGALLGSLVVPVAAVSGLTWNYFDLTSLNVAVTSGTDYFIVLVPGAGSTFTMAYETLSNSGRSFYNNGVWTAFNDWRIRTVVYSNSGALKPSITLTSAVGTNAQQKCTGSAITAITYATTGATGATFSGLPTGVTGAWAANVVTISGASSVAGTFNYTVTLTGGSCGGVTANGTITVTQASTATAGGPNTVCRSASPTALTLTGASVGGGATTGAWSIISGGGTLSSTAQTASPASITYTPAANFNGTVTLRLTSNFGTGCTAVTADRTINVTALPTATAGGPNTVCQSATPSPITLTGASVGGSATTGAWSIISGGGTLSSTAQTASPATVTYTPAANFSGIVTLRLTSNFGTGCSAVTADRTINVTALPTATAGGPNSVCQSASPSAITLSGASVGGGATTGAWSIISGSGSLSSTAQTATPAAVTFTPTANFNGTVTLQLTTNAVNTCVGVATRTITVNALPIANAGGPNSVCQSATPTALTLSGASVGNGATTGAWSIVSGGGTLSSTAQTATPATVTYTPAANFSGTVTLLLTTNAINSCTGTATRTITVNPLPTVSAGGPNSVCQSATPSAITLNSATFGGGATTAAWSIVSGGGTLSNTAQIAIPSSVTYTPAANFSGTVILQLTTNAVNSCVASAQRIITVNALPTANAGGPNTVCQSATPAPITLSGASVGGSATTGAWSIFSGGGTLSSTSQTGTPATVTYTPAANFSGTVTLQLTTNFGVGCTAVVVNRTINVTALPTANAGGPTNVCQSASPAAIALSGASVSGGATTGAWSIISGGGTLSSTAQTATPATVTYTPAANFSGTVTLQLTTNAVNTCVGTSLRTINVNAIASANAGGPNTVCQSATPLAITLSGASVGGGATTGAWSIISGGGTLSSTLQTATPATVSYTPAANFSGTVTLRLTSNAGSGCSAVTSDRIINVTTAPTVNAGGPISVCQSASPSSITLSGAFLGGSASSGAWSIISGGGTLSSTAPTATPSTITYTPAANFSGTVTLRLTTNFGTGCSAVFADRTINVTTSPTANAGGPNNVCQSASPAAITLSGASVGGSATTGAWSIITGGGTLSSTAQTATPATVTYTPAANFTGTVTLRLTSNFGAGCTAAIANRTINVNPRPSTTITGNLTFCPGGSTTLTASGGFPSFLWSTGAVTPSIVVNTPGNYTVTVTNGNGCTNTATASVTVGGSCGSILNLTALIEGYHIGGQVQRSVLFENGLTANTLLCDTITVELHDQFAFNTVVATQNVVLGTNGTAQLSFPAGVNGGTFYIVIRGRNLLETWSKNPVTFGAVTTYNFKLP